MAQWLSWLERRPVTAKVVGSSPIWVVKGLFNPCGVLAQLGEHLPYKQRVIGSSPTRGVFLSDTLDTPSGDNTRLHGQAVKTSPFHGGNTGSIPVGVI